jgi:hypothetical protein
MLIELCCVVGLHIHSWHHENRPDGTQYNNDTPGLYIRSNASHTVAGMYQNSINKKSFYVGKDFETNQNRRLKFGITMGLVTGYDKLVLPFVVPSVTFDNVRFSVVPHTPLNAGAMNVAIEFKF